MKNRESTTSKEKSTGSDLKGTERFDSGTETTVNEKGENRTSLKIVLSLTLQISALSKINKALDPFHIVHKLLKKHNCIIFLSLLIHPQSWICHDDI